MQDCSHHSKTFTAYRHLNIPLSDILISLPMMFVSNSRISATAKLSEWILHDPSTFADTGWHEAHTQATSMSRLDTSSSTSLRVEVIPTQMMSSSGPMAAQAARPRWVSSWNWVSSPSEVSSTWLISVFKGPCRVTSANSTERFEHAWNSHANVFFVDQPVGTGFSYADYGEQVVRPRPPTWSRANCFPEYLCGGRARHGCFRRHLLRALLQI